MHLELLANAAEDDLAERKPTAFYAFDHQQIFWPDCRQHTLPKRTDTNRLAAVERSDEQLKFHSVGSGDGRGHGPNL